jgi:hypothetical protein
MGEPGRQRLLEDYRRATRRARRVVDTRFWDDPGCAPRPCSSASGT